MVQYSKHYYQKIDIVHLNYVVSFILILLGTYSFFSFLKCAPRFSMLALVWPFFLPLGFPVGTYTTFTVLGSAGLPLGFPVGTYGPFLASVFAMILEMELD